MIKSSFKSFLLSTLYFSLFTASNVLYADSPAQILDEFLSGLETYSAAFEQRLIDETGEELETSVGVFYMRRPGMFHWAYYEPYSQVIISDSLSMWIYEEDLEQVIIKDISNQIESSPAAILGGDVKLTDHYVVIDKGLEDQTHWLELTPRDIQSQYDYIRLGFMDEHLKKMILTDQFGQQTDIDFLDAKRNPQLNIELFSFTPPEGTDVIDNRRPM